MSAATSPFERAGGDEDLSAPATWIASAFDAIDEGLIVWDERDRVVTWNRAVLSLFPYLQPALHRGATAREVITAAIVATRSDMPAAERAARVERRLSERQADGVVDVVERDGRVIEIVERRAPRGGRVSLCRDVTQYRHAARAQRECEARFCDGIGSMADGFTMWDPEDRLLAWNDQFVAMNPEVAGHLVLGMTFPSLIEIVASRRFPDTPADERAAIAALRLDRHRNPGPAFEIEIGDGRIIEVMERRTTEGGIVSVHRDVTTRRETQRALERALAAERELNVQQRRFVSIASHEFRTPLAIILSAIQRIESRLAGTLPSDVVIRFQRIHAAIGRLGDLVERMLSSARSDEGRLDPQFSPVDIVAVLRDAIARQATITPAIRVDLRAPDVAPTIEADPALLEQVFANLLSNAAKYSGPSRDVTVVVEAAADGVRIAVRDHGIGIPADELSQLFTRFFRARTAQGIAGTGIGLHLVRTLVEAHGGQVAVASEVGAGSTFTVQLPRTRSAVRAA
ncbi:MAG: PAS-domain containing protein [Alphaproteobacteria bacterium]|nr:PAS-domain containing protein [Alphaproteobacteria bacterium]